jgi:hypothetical protein
LSRICRNRLIGLPDFNPLNDHAVAQNRHALAPKGLCKNKYPIRRRKCDIVSGVVGSLSAN